MDDIGETQRALEIMEKAARELEPLWDYVPNRPLGWLAHIMAGVVERLRDDSRTIAPKPLDGTD